MPIQSTRAARTYHDQRVTDLRLTLAAHLLLATGPLLASTLKAHQLDESLQTSLRQFSRVYRRPEAIERFHHALVEVLVARSVDNFNSYLADVFSDLFRSRPEILKSSQKVEVADVLDCSSMSEVYSMLADRKVDELAYGGFKSIRKFLVERIGIPDIPSDDVATCATEAIAARNVTVHNRGRVNARYLAETGRSEALIGQPLSLSVDDTGRFDDALTSIVRHIDGALLSKFGAEVFNPDLLPVT